MSEPMQTVNEDELQAYADGQPVMPPPAAVPAQKREAA